MIYKQLLLLLTILCASVPTDASMSVRRATMTIVALQCTFLQAATLQYVQTKVIVMCIRTHYDFNLQRRIVIALALLALVYVQCLTLIT
jgi:hypothetical protein